MQPQTSGHRQCRVIARPGNWREESQGVSPVTGDAVAAVPRSLWFLLLLLLLTGCHGSDIRFGTGHTFDGGRSLGSVSGKHDTGGSWLVDEGGGSSAWVEVGFQITPQTVVVRQERAGETALYPPPVLPPPPAVITQPLEATPVVAHVEAEPATQPTEDPDIDWEEVVVAVALGLIPLLFGGRYAVRKVRASRAKKEADG